MFLAIVGPDEAGYAASSSGIARAGSETASASPGERAGDALARAYAGVDLLVLPAHYGENFANVVVEAAMQGTAAFVSDRVGLAEWVSETGTGRVLPLEVDAWVDAIGAVTETRVAVDWPAERSGKQPAPISLLMRSLGKC